MKKILKYIWDNIVEIVPLMLMAAVLAFVIQGCL